MMTKEEIFEEQVQAEIDHIFTNMRHRKVKQGIAATALMRLWLSVVLDMSVSKPDALELISELFIDSVEAIEKYHATEKQQRSDS